MLIVLCMNSILLIGKVNVEATYASENGLRRNQSSKLYTTSKLFSLMDGYMCIDI